MKIGICNDHAGVKLKQDIIEHLKKQGFEVINYGTDVEEPFDYPDAAKLICAGIKSGEVERGIAICGTGVGISMACNKHKGIRACCCSEPASARLSREHNNANVVCFGARVVSNELAYDIVDAFCKTDFSNGERHLNRIAKIKEIEDNQ